MISPCACVSKYLIGKLCILSNISERNLNNIPCVTVAIIRVYKNALKVTNEYAETIITIKPIKRLRSSAVMPVLNAGVTTWSIKSCIYTVETKLPTELNRIKNNAKHKRTL